MISFKTLKPFLLTALLLCALPAVVSAHVRAAGTSLGNRQLSSVNCQLPQAPASSVITFADPEMERLCLASWDTDGDGHLSQAEAAAVTTIENLFSNNTAITSFDELRFFTGLTSIGSFTFYGCTNLKSVKMPTGLSEIGEGAFAECASLQAAVVPSGVRVIGKSAFLRCRSLAQLELPNGLTTIGESAFFYCNALKSVTIPASVTTIGATAFAQLASRPDIYCRATVPPTAAADAFAYSTARGTLHVPYGTANDYHSAEGWKAFNAIVEMESGEWRRTIIVTTLDGATVEYLLDKNTKVKIAKPNLTIETDGMLLTYKLESMSQVRYGRKFVSLGIHSATVSTESPIKMEDEMLFLNGLGENTLVGVYNAEGKTMMSRRYSGSAEVSLKGLPAGVYFVKFNNESYKILKK